MVPLTENDTIEEIRHTLRCFDISDDDISISTINNGHINATFKVFVRTPESQTTYIVQAVNTFVFKKPIEMMENISGVTAHIEKKLIEAHIPTRRRVLHFASTREGFYFVQGSSNRFWRAYEFIENSTTYDTVTDARLLYNAGKAFGEFQKQLSDYPMETLHNTIPDFHNTKKRMHRFFEVVEADELNLAKNVSEEIEFFVSRVNIAEKLIDIQEKGLIPLRVTHNDTKYNNILIDNATGEALCVIDLDTVMPGLAAYDFGDAIRYAANTAAEDEVDLSKVELDLELYEAFTRGFIGNSGGFFTRAELDSMAWGARIITMELASRFLADYLQGDRYFRIHRPGQNLDRARNQIKLVLDMEKKFDSMCEFVAKYNK